MHRNHHRQQHGARWQQGVTTPMDVESRREGAAMTVHNDALTTPTMHGDVMTTHGNVTMTHGDVTMMSMHMVRTAKG